MFGFHPATSVQMYRTATADFRDDVCSGPIETCDLGFRTNAW
jgi:hypothetical protein